MSAWIKARRVLFDDDEQVLIADNVKQTMPIRFIHHPRCGATCGACVFMPRPVVSLLVSASLRRRRAAQPCALLDGIPSASLVPFVRRCARLAAPYI